MSDLRREIRSEDSQKYAVANNILASRENHGKLSDRPDISRGEIDIASNPDIALRESQFPKN